MCLQREYEFNSLSFMYCSNSHLCAFKLDFPENFPHKWIHLEQQRDSIGGWNVCVCVCVCAFGWLGSYNGAYRWKFLFQTKAPFSPHNGSEHTLNTKLANGDATLCYLKYRKMLLDIKRSYIHYPYLWTWNSLSKQTFFAIYIYKNIAKILYNAKTYKKLQTV